MKYLKKIITLFICTAIVLSVCGCNGTQPSPAPSDSGGSSLPEGSYFSVVFYDMGHGDAAIVECDGKYMLIDGGSKADSQKMYAILKEKNIPHLDYIVATGTSDEHIGGLAGALNFATAGSTFCSSNSFSSEAFMDFKKYADKNGGGITVPNAGNRYELGAAQAEFIWVDKSSSPALAVKIIYGETAFLFAGDITAESEKQLLESNSNLKADVLKVADHGSDNATTSGFLRSVSPQFAVISAEGSRLYPGEETLSLLEVASVKLYRTDLNGDISCTSDGKTVTFTAQKQAKEDQLFKSGQKTVEKEPDKEEKQQTEPEKTPAVTTTPKPTTAPTTQPTAQPTATPTVNIFADELYEANLLTNLVSAYGSVKNKSLYMQTEFINGYFMVDDSIALLNTSIDNFGHCTYNGWYKGYNFYDNGTRVVQQVFAEQLDGDKIVPGQQDIAGYFMYEEDVEYIGREGEDYLFRVTTYSTPYTITVDGMSLAVKKIQWPLDPGSDQIEFIYGEWVEGQDILNCWADGSPMRMVNVYVDIYENGEHKSLYRPFWLPVTWELVVDSMAYQLYTYMDSNYTQPYSYPGDYTNYDLYVTNSVG